MSSGSASYSVSATNYGARSADAYYILSAPDEINGPLHITGNLTVDGTSQLTGAVTCGSTLATAGSVTVGSPSANAGLTVNGLCVVGDGVHSSNLTVNGTIVNSGNLTSGGSVVVGTPTANSGLTVNGGCTVGDGVHPAPLQVNGTATVTGDIVAGGDVTVGTTLANANLVVNGATQSKAVTVGTAGILAEALFCLNGIGNMGTGLVTNVGGNVTSFGHVYLGNLLIQWGNDQSNGDGQVFVTFPIPYPLNNRPCLTSQVFDNGNGEYRFTNIVQFTNVAAQLTVFDPDAASPHHGGSGQLVMWLAFGPAT